jgi:hypothetical protein
MDVVISLVGVLGLIAGVLLVILASWDRQRSRRAVIEAETELSISREAAARQLLELRKRLAEAEADQAHIASLQDEVRRLRDKNRRLQALHALETGTGSSTSTATGALAMSTGASASLPPSTPVARHQGRPEAPGEPIRPDRPPGGARLSNFPELPDLPQPDTTARRPL